jgi:hypothetical protein
LVSASCTTRYAVSPAPVGTGRGSPATVSSTGTPVSRTRPTSAANRSSPGCGARPPAPGSGSAVSTVSRPITCRSSAIAARPPASTASSASRAWSVSVARTLRAAPAWITITLTLWVTTSCSSRAIRARSCSAARRTARARSSSSTAIRALLWSARRRQVRRPLAATTIEIRIRNVAYRAGTVA